ncbi:protein RRP5 homolog [Electrophorus electricus]|uniref:protein RRP5 homolog n=1 Tax=Electrophorus electricus TaxID=8005 RepID=UPI0015D0AC90|nr:protein RRP5 homolog [Electrophorus electricus]
MASIEEDFPRGGSDSKASKPKAVKPCVEVDNLFETREPGTKKKRKADNKQEDKEKGKAWKTEADGLKLNAATSVDILHLKNLKVGTVMLGSVKEISDFEVVLGLPNGLKGYLPISGICDAYNKILSEKVDTGDDLEDVVSPSHLLAPGLLVRCIVSSLEPSKEGFISLKVSVNPKEVNKELSSSFLKAGMTLGGCVESVEDHGFLIDIGVKGTKAFLPKETKTGAKSFKQDLKVGQYVTALLEEVQSSGRVARLSLDPSAIAQACAEIQHGWTLGSLLPGLLVQAHIKKVTAHGLIVTFLSSYTGTVDFMHIDPDKLSTYAVGNKVNARILYVEPSSRLVGLSLRSHLLPPSSDVLNRLSTRTGEVLHGCRMTSVHHHSGALMELPDGAVAFVHKNQMKEPKEEFNMNRQLAQPEHTLRIMDYSPLEQMHLATLRKSIINATFFSYSDIRVGQLIEGTVQGLERYGMHVKISDHIKGLVPRIHLADVVLSNPEKKFKEGMRLMFRVLSVDLLNKKLVLTRKKALVESQLPVLTTYADARPGLVFLGFIVCIKDFGCIVRFYGGIKGLVPMEELTTEPTINAQGLFYIGQVVKAKVLRCDAEGEKLLLSFKAVTQGDVQQVNTAKFAFEVGKKVEAVVLRKDRTGLEVSILPEEVPALIPTEHLSDHVTNCPLLWAALQEGDTISDAVCLRKNKQSITLSKKPLLMAALEPGAMVTAFSELRVGVIMLGWVKSIMHFGVFVDFPHGLCGLAPKAAMSDKFITDTAGVFQVGQTVLAKVTNLDEEKHRFLVSLKVSDVSSAEGDAQARLIQGQRERRAILDMMTSRGDTDLLQQLSSISLGDKLKMTVGETKEDGSVSLISDQLCSVTVLASKYHTTDVNTTPGHQVSAAVLHVDPVTSQVHVSLLPKLTGKKKKLDKCSRHTATVEYADEDFAVISVGNTGHLTVVSTTTHLNETFRFESEKLSVDRNLTVTVTEPSCEDLGGQCLVTWQLRGTRHERGTSESKGQKHCYDVGLVAAEVKAIKPLHVLVTLPDGDLGSVHVSQIHESPRVGSFPTSSLKIGSKVKARFIGSHEVRGYNYLPFSHQKCFTLPELTLLPSKLMEDVNVQSQENERKYTPGEEIKCFISKYIPEKKYLELAVSLNIYGTVELLAMTTKLREANHPHKLFKCGQCVTAKVVGVSSKNAQQLNLSLIGTHKLKQGTVTMGMVQEINPQKGLVLKLPFGKSGLASLTDLSDTYTDNPLEQYKEGQLFRCCVVKTNKTLTLSLRPSRIHSEKALPAVDVDIGSMSELSEGQVVRGYVKNIGEMGIFVRLSRSVIGRVLIQNATNYFVTNHEIFTEHLPPNTLVTAKVIHVDAESNRLDLSLLPDDTGKADVLPESLGLPLRLKGKDKEKYDRKNPKRKRSVSESKQDEVGKKKKKKKQKKDQKDREEKEEAKTPQAEDLDSGVDVYFREEETDKARKRGRSKSAAAQERGRLQVPSAFCWDAALNSLQPASAADITYESSSEEEGDQSKPAKKSRRELEQERQEAERKLSRLESELQDPSARPENSSQFERLLLSSPDSSLLWLQYMAFHLQATQVEQARAVAERALRTISFREEQEKLNVWVALLNLENMYGTEESLQRVFERAVQYCEPMPVYQQLADIYAKSGKVKEAESLYKNMVKRFKQEKAVWQSYGSFLLRQGQTDAANALLQRALQSLSNKEHVDLISKFARLEFQYGNSERAKAMFEKVLSSYPKRTDLWSIFIDLTMKHSSQKDVRDLFDRVIHLSVSVKKVKFFFKRYLDYEKKHGTSESIQAVKQKALEYVDSKGSEATN